MKRALILLPVLIFLACSREKPSSVLDHSLLSTQYFQEDAGWYLDNIPFFECSDKQIEQVYYYRWKLYKAHIRHTGENQYVITEFINHVPWDREPFCTINAASMHHIYEGRWLRDPRFMDGYINNLYQQGGNDRRYSESIADASYARYLVNGDSTFIMAQLDSMIASYNGWSDHYDSARHLYYIPAMPDATEYTIASIDATGGKDGFDDGEAFRPTINSYMYGNALAISKIAAMKGDKALSEEYQHKAITLRDTARRYLWNPSLNHYTDRFKVNNQFVHEWDFIRGRELAGMIPWYFDLPPDDSTTNAAWDHITDTSNLLGAYGFRTQEPSYEYYFHQYQFFEGKRGSQWNGPSWPYQSSQVLTGMANLLNDYQHSKITTADYLKMLRLFTRQHYLPDGRINLVENYDPNLGGPIVYFYWSNHYNHSSYNNLVISGLCGIRPSEGDMLEINPLIDSSIQYFCLEDLSYHGHSLTVVYDQDGQKYKLGKGLTVFLDGKKQALTNKGNKYELAVGPRLKVKYPTESTNYALNLSKKGFPQASASVNSITDSLFQAIDGKAWYFREISNRWTTQGSTEKADWYALDFGQPRELSSIKLSFYSDGKDFGIPEKVDFDYLDNGVWKPVQAKQVLPQQLTANTINTFSFDKMPISKLRVKLAHEKRQVAIVELECY